MSRMSVCTGGRMDLFWRVVLSRSYCSGFNVLQGIFVVLYWWGQRDQMTARDGRDSFFPRLLWQLDRNLHMSIILLLQLSPGLHPLFLEHRKAECLVQGHTDNYRTRIQIKQSASRAHALSPCDTLKKGGSHRHRGGKSGLLSRVTLISLECLFQCLQCI